jgi:hypothetical protein
MPRTRRRLLSAQGMDIQLLASVHLDQILECCADHEKSRNSLASGTPTSGIKVKADEDGDSTQPRLHHWHTVPMQPGFQPHLFRPGHAFEMPAGPSMLSGGLRRVLKRDAPEYVSAVPAYTGTT